MNEETLFSGPAPTSTNLIVLKSLWKPQRSRKAWSRSPAHPGKARTFVQTTTAILYLTRMPLNRIQSIGHQPFKKYLNRMRKTEHGLSKRSVRCQMGVSRSPASGSSSVKHFLMVVRVLKHVLVTNAERRTFS